MAFRRTADYNGEVIPSHHQQDSSHSVFSAEITPDVDGHAIFAVQAAPEHTIGHSIFRARSQDIFDKYSVVFNAGFLRKIGRVHSLSFPDDIQELIYRFWKIPVYQIGDIVRVRRKKKWYPMMVSHYKRADEKVPSDISHFLNAEQSDSVEQLCHFEAVFLREPDRQIDGKMNRLYFSRGPSIETLRPPQWVFISDHAVCCCAEDEGCLQHSITPPMDYENARKFNQRKDNDSCLVM